MMSIEHLPGTFDHKMAIINKAKQLISKRPGIYVGDLIYHLRAELDSLSVYNIDQVFFELVKDGYEFRGSSFYPPKIVGPLYKQLKKVTILTEGLNEMDFEIFLSIWELKEKATLSNITGRVIFQNVTYSEREVKYRIGLLFKERFILARPSKKDPKYLDINWTLVNGRD